MSKTFIPFKEPTELLSVPEIQEGHLTGALIGVVHRTRALNDLLGAWNRDGEQMPKEMCAGVYDLFAQQTHILASITNAVEVWEEERRTEEQAVEAERNGVAENIRKVREAFIAASAEAGTEPQVIAQALNIRRSNVERVISQLRGAATVPPEAACA